MPVAQFLTQLFEDGRPILESDGEPSKKEIRAGVDVVLEFEQVYRESIFPEPPEPDSHAVAWSVRQLYWVAQRLAYQHLRVEMSDAKLHSAPQKNSAVVYSVDLLFRYLPDLLRLARASSAHADLMDKLQLWCAEWPLSSVGVPVEQEPDIEPILNHKGLRQLYVDRILATGDVSRLDHPEVADYVQAALGAYSELSLRCAEHLQLQRTNSHE